MEHLEKYFDTAFGAHDGIKKLRELILELAFKGLLVNQNNKEISAIKLSHIIQKNKNSGSDYSSNQPNTLDQIPPRWKIIELSKVVEVLDSLRKPVTRSDRVQGPFPYYGASGIVDYVKEYIFDEPLVLVGEDGAKWGRGDKTAFMISGKTWVNNHAHVLRPNRNILLDEFLVYYLTSLDLQSYITGMTVPKLNQARLNSIPIPIPPIQEQKRIIIRIDELMSRCNMLEKLRAERDQKRLAVHIAAIRNMLYAPNQGTYDDAWQFITLHFRELYTVQENVAELRKVIMQLAVMGKLVKQDVREGTARELLQKLVAKRNLLVRKGAIRKSTIEENEQTVRQISNSTEIPASWSWVNLKQLGYFLGGKTPSKNKSVYWNGNIPWVSPKDMKSLAIKDSEDHVTQLGVNTGLAIIPTNSILMVVRSGILKRAFPVAINKIDCTINQDLKGLVPFSTEITPYLQLMFRGFETNILSKLTKQGVTVESVKFEEFVSIQFPIPPLLEQNRIVDKVNHLMQLCDNLNQQIDVALQIQGEVLGAVMGKVV